MKVLSLFDGISIGHLALKNLGIEHDYTSVEIDKWAIQVSKYHFPEIKKRHLDVRDFDPTESYDLIIGGFPCQDLSSQNLNGKGLDGNKSSLFFEYLRILNKIKETNPDVLFLVENVKGKNSDRDKISEYLDVEPILINSRKFTPQNRNRYYWTNISVNVDIYNELDLKECEHDVICYAFNKVIRQRYTRALTTKVGRKTLKSQAWKRVINGEIEGVNIEWLSSLQGFPEGFITDMNFSNSRSGILIGNSWTLPVIEFIFSSLKET